MQSVNDETKKLNETEEKFKDQIKEAEELMADPEKAKAEAENLLEDISEAKGMGNQVIKFTKRMLKGFIKGKKAQKRKELLAELCKIRTIKRRKKNKVARATRKKQR